MLKDYYQLQTIKPESFKVSESEIRKRFCLSDCDSVIDYGYENEFNFIQKQVIQKTYDMVSLYIRTRPDFLVQKDGSMYLVEAKQRANTVEAVQLFFNKELCNSGVNVVYSFPDFNIPAYFIPIQEIFVPQRYQDPFDRFFKDEIRTSIHDVEFTYLSNTKGSGDPFVKLDKQTLEEFSRTLE